jgi:hypothetical protein
MEAPVLEEEAAVMKSLQRLPQLLLVRVVIWATSTSYDTTPSSSNSARSSSNNRKCLSPFFSSLVLATPNSPS